MAATGAVAPGQNSAYRPPWRIWGRIVIAIDAADADDASLAQAARAARLGFARAGIPILQCYYESHQIWMSAERDNLGIEVPFSGGENSNSTAH